MLSFLSIMALLPAVLALPNPFAAAVPNAVPAPLSPRSAAVADPNKNWTFVNFSRWCNDTLNKCTYQYTLRDNFYHLSYPCLYTDAPGTGTGVRKARYSDYSNLQCSASGTGANIYVNLGYNNGGFPDNQNRGFVVIVPTNRNLNPAYNAYFGYTLVQLADHNVTPSLTEQAYQEGTFSKAKRGSTLDTASTTSFDYANPPAWTVRSLNRVCKSYPAVCTYAFEIDQNIPYGPAPSQCHITHDGSSTSSFYAVPCNENNGWVISWGYSDQYGFAVMSVVSQPLQLVAWFGFNNINSVFVFPDVGPNAAQPL